MMRKIPPLPGMAGTVRADGPGAHAGWADGTPVTVQGRDGIGVNVRSAEGVEARLPHWLVDVGSEYFIGGRWLAEDDPRTLDYIARLLHANLVGARVDAALARDHQANIRRYRELLTRYGRTPE